VPLAGVEHHVGKHRHNLPEFGRPFPESRLQRAHLRPEADTGHAEVALHTLLQVRVQPRVLRIRKLETLRNVNRVRGGLAGGEVTAVRLQAHLVADHPQTALLRGVTRRGFRVKLAIKHHHRLGIRVIEYGVELLVQAPGRENICAVQKAVGLVIFKMVAAQHPAERREDDLTQRHALVRKVGQRIHAQPGDLSLHLCVRRVAEPAHILPGVQRARLRGAAAARRRLRKIVAVGSQHAAAHAMIGDKPHHRRAGQPQRPAGDLRIGRVEAHTGQPRRGVEQDHRARASRERRGLLHRAVDGRHAAVIAPVGGLLPDARENAVDLHTAISFPQGVLAQLGSARVKSARPRGPPV